MRYEPTRQQLGFHQDNRRVRAFVGDPGCGKTTALIAEADAWCPGVALRSPKPEVPATVLLFTMSHFILDQIYNFGLPDIVIRGSVRIREGMRFEYQNGSELFVSKPTPDSMVQFSGVGPSLVAFDGVPKKREWNEMRMRRRVGGIVVTARDWRDLIDLL